MHPENEVFYLIEVPGADRRYVERKMTPERYRMLKAQKEGTRIFRVNVSIPRVGRHYDQSLQAQPVPAEEATFE